MKGEGALSLSLSLSLSTIHKLASKLDMYVVVVIYSIYVCTPSLSGVCMIYVSTKLPQVYTIYICSTLYST